MEMKTLMTRQKFMLVRLMLRQLHNKKVDFKEEALVKLTNLNDQMKIQIKELKDIESKGGIDTVLKLKPIENVDLDATLNTYDNVREEIKGNIAQIADKLKEHKDHF